MESQDALRIERAQGVRDRECITLEQELKEAKARSVATPSRTPAPQPIKAAGKPRLQPQPEAGPSTWPASLVDRVSPPQPPPLPEVGPSSRPATLADRMAKMRPPNSFHDTFGTGLGHRLQG